jgi:hypothetical protein
VERSLVDNGVTDPDTLRKSKEAVAAAKWERDSKLGPCGHAALVHKQVEHTEKGLANLADKVAALQRQTLDAQAQITSMQAERDNLVALEAKAAAAPPLDAPLAHGSPVAFRELRQQLEGELDTFATDNPCEKLRHTLSTLLNMVADKFSDDADNEFRDCTLDEVTVDDDDFKRFAEAANALDGVGDQPDKFNALQRVFSDTVKGTTERKLRERYQQESQWSTSSRRRVSNPAPFSPY